MKTDSLNRRTRTNFEPKGKAVEITPRMQRVLSALDRRGPLPTHLLFEFWRGGETANYPQFQRHLTKLVRETRISRHGEDIAEPPLIRPGELNPLYVFSEPSWYDISETGRTLLPDGLRAQYPVPKRDPWHHRAMGACRGASFDLLAANFKMRTIDKDEIFKHEKCPSETRAQNNPLLITLPDGKLEPDDLVGFEHLGKGYRWYGVEDDRATERINSKDKLQTSLIEKLNKWQRVFAGRLYQKQWGLTNLRVLFLTVNEGRIQSLLRELRGQPFAERFLFKSISSFGRSTWSAPRAPLNELFEPWQTVNGPFDITAL